MLAEKALQKAAPGRCTHQTHCEPGRHVPSAQGCGTCTHLTGVTAQPRTPRAVQMVAECSASRGKLPRAAQVPHCCPGSRVAQSICCRGSPRHQVLMALVVAHSFIKSFFNLAWSASAELEVVSAHSEENRWHDCHEREMPRRDTEKTVRRSRNYPLSQTTSFCLQKESRSNLLASICLQCFTKVISQFRLLSVSSEYSPGHQSIHTRYQEIVENLTSTSSPEAPSSDLVQGKVALTHARCRGTRSSRQPREQLCIRVLALRLRAGLLYTPVRRSYLYLCLLPPCICACPSSKTDYPTAPAYFDQPWTRKLHPARSHKAWAWQFLAGAQMTKRC